MESSIDNSNIEGTELFSISHDGKRITQLTNLTAYYPKLYIKQFSWSPDGHYIAMWLDITPVDMLNEETFASYLKLAVLNMETGQVTNYCIDGRNAYSWEQGRAPTWSPDSQQLLVMNARADFDNVENTTYTNHVIVVDIAQQKAVEIATDLWPDGWLKSP